MVLFKKFLRSFCQAAKCQPLKAMPTEVSIHSISNQSLGMIFIKNTTYDLNNNKVYFANFPQTLSTPVMTYITERQ